MMPGRHDFDLRAERGPERAQIIDRVLIGAFLRRQDAPAVDEELNKAASRPSIKLNASYAFQFSRKVSIFVPPVRLLDAGDYRIPWIRSTAFNIPGDVW
jgi:hypothetical protein